ncbi:MAG TPA: hypothetical protein ENK26_00455 [Gammaproteobacteria bacterium]|nr:hypothetical protein [Gammaproteobacteria bacterium]
MPNSLTERSPTETDNPAPSAWALALALLLGGCGGGGAKVVEPPASQADSYSLYTTDASLEIAAEAGVLANDNDGDPSGLTAVLVTPPAHASEDFELTEDGGFRYVPNSPDVRKDQFTYRAVNDSGESPETTVTLTIIPNQRPIAVTDDYLIPLPVAPLEVTAENGLLSNDTDADGDPLTLRLVTPPEHHIGAFELAPDGSFRYDFAGGDAATDQFTYSVSDGKAESEPVTVTLRINTPPVANSDCQLREKSNQPITGQLSSLTSDAENQKLTYANVTAETATNLGTLSIDATTGAFSYTPPATGEQGYRDEFIYQVDDGFGGVSQGRLQLIVGKRRIMPLGDSITWGVTSVEQDPDTGELRQDPPPDEAIGYRKRLYELLTREQYPIDLVGAERNGEAAGLADPDHQGIPGIKSDAVARSIYTWLDQTPADIVLLHIGTNDQSEDISGVNAILTAIDRWATHHDTPIKVLLAKIIDARPYGHNKVIQLFNTRLENLVAPDWPEVILVDQFHALSYPEDMTSNDVTGLHPAQSGYDKMADKWFETLEKEKLIFTCQSAPPEAGANGNAASPSIVAAGWR